MKQTIVLFFLAAGTVSDIRKKSISAKYLILWGTVNLIYLCVESLYLKNPEVNLQIVWDIIPGLVSLGLAFLTREQIGYGDGWVILLMGILIGVKRVLATVTAAFVLVFICSLILVVIRKAKKKTTLPFIPFLFAGYLLIIAIKI